MAPGKSLTLPEVRAAFCNSMIMGRFRENPEF
jgi:hypothetical protein